MLSSKGECMVHKTVQLQPMYAHTCKTETHRHVHTFKLVLAWGCCEQLNHEQKDAANAKQEEIKKRQEVRWCADGCCCFLFFFLGGGGGIGM